MEMPCLLARKLHRNVSPSSTGLRAQCCSSSVIPAFHGCYWRQAEVWLTLSRSGFTGHQWQKSLSCWREAALSLSHATLLVMYSPMCHTLCMTLSDFVLSDCPLFPSALFSIVQQLWLCLALPSSRREPIITTVVGRWVCVTKQHRPLSLDPRSFCFP